VSDVLACLMFVCAHGMDESELLEKNGNISWVSGVWGWSWLLSVNLFGGMGLEGGEDMVN
jgi:hypothetical protein